MILKLSIDNVREQSLKQSFDLIINKNNELISPELTNFLSNLADIEISFTENLAGYSKDIDGQVNVK